MGEVAETMIRDAMRALVARDESFISEVYEHEDELDDFQIEIDRQTTEAMVLQSPVAFDLRFLVMVARINVELERIGDLCVNICENAQLLLSSPPVKPPLDLAKMADLAGRMVHLGLRALLEGATDKAFDVIRADDEVDALNDQVFCQLLNCMLGDTREITPCLCLILVSKQVERIADHATNIAEEVIYLVSGKDVRHRRPGREKKGPTP
jgi:phosphate transport system protein